MEKGQGVRTVVRLCFYAFVMTMYPSQALGHTLEAIGHLNLATLVSIDAAKVVSYHGIVVMHVLHDAHSTAHAVWDAIKLMFKLVVRAYRAIVSATRKVFESIKAGVVAVTQRAKKLWGMQK